MFRPRVIPCLLLRGTGLVKTEKFRRPRYLGDAMNAVRIFNAKQADELVFLDIDATREARTPRLDLIEEIGDECFMPFAVGGGVRSIDDVRALLNAGAEKVVINSAAIEEPMFVREACDTFGSSTIVASVDVKKTWLGRYEVVTRGATKRTGRGPVEVAAELGRAGVGEIIVTSVDRDGTMSGYDLTLTKMVADEVDVPVVASGGAGGIEDFVEVLRSGGAWAVAAGSYFVFHGPRRAVLISFPGAEERAALSIEGPSAAQR